MKYILLLICFFSAGINSFSQNVGIGVLVPEYPLTVKAASTGAGIGIGISQQDAGATAKVGFYTAGGGAYIQTHNDVNLNFATNNSVAQMTLQKSTGNFGIGITNPTAKLHVNGTVKITDGSQDLGKVLTSDASGNATWMNAAFGNTERFQFRFFYRHGTGGTITTFYNFGTATASLANFAMHINITKAGLYHFDINQFSDYFGDLSNLSMSCQVRTGGNLFIKSNTFFQADPSTYSTASYDKSFDIYIPAPTALEFVIFYAPGSNGTFGSGTMTVTGHLIAE